MRDDRITRAMDEAFAVVVAPDPAWKSGAPIRNAGIDADIVAGEPLKQIAHRWGVSVKLVQYRRHKIPNPPPIPGRRVSQALALRRRAEIKRLREQGMSLAQIGRSLGISPNTVIYHLKRTP